jgi:hypothetical protein
VPRPADLVLVAGYLTLVVADLWRYGIADGRPSGDVALIALRTRDAPADLPLVGVFSRYGWNHPGPWQLWWSRPFQVLLGDPGLYVASWVVGAAALGLTLWLLRRRAGPGVALTALVALAAVVSAAGNAYLADPWNPTVSALPVVLALVAAWATGEGWRWGPVVTVAAASFAVGAHVGAAAPAALAIVLALVWGLRRVADGAFGVRWLVFAGIAGIAAWLPAIADQIGGDGNLGRIARFSLGDDAGERYGLSRGVAAAVRLLGWSGSWRRGAGQQDGFTGERIASLSAGDVVVLILLAALALLALRWCSTAERRLLLVAWAAWLTAIVTFAGVTRPAYPYLAAWSAPAAALVWTAALGPWVERGLGALADRGPGAWIVPGVAAASIALFVGGTGASATEQWRTRLDVAGLAREVDAARAGRPVLVCGRDPYLGAYLSALLNELDQRDVPVRSRDHGPVVVGDARVPLSGERTFDVTLMTGRQDHEALAASGVAPIAADDELTAAERARADALVARLQAALATRPPGPGTDLLRIAVDDGGAGLLRTVAEGAPELADDLAALAALRPGVQAAVVAGCT